MKMRFMDKTKKSNKRCGSCKHLCEGRKPLINIKQVNKFCGNLESTEYLRDKYYWNCCKWFEWAENIVDTSQEV